MRFNGLNRPLRLVSSIAVGLVAVATLGQAADKPGFQPKPIDQYANKQTSEGVTIAAEPFTTDEQTKDPFGKLNPWKHDILPVLVVIRNSSANAIRVDRIQFVYELPDRSKMDATPAADVKYAKGAKQPKASVSPLGIKISSKNPLAAPEIEVRAFSAKMIPPGDTASGFVYFQTDVTSAGASLYITSLSNAVTGKDLLYFEIPLSGK